MKTIIEIKEDTIKDAASKGVDFFITTFTSEYKDAISNKLSADNMQILNASQHTLLAYDIFRNEMLEGGFCQLIQNGYGNYIFGNPFAKMLRIWGATDFSKFIYRAKKIYDAHREEMEKERSDEEFMAMYEQYEELNEMDDIYIEKEEDITNFIAGYVDAHIEDFAKIVK